MNDIKANLQTFLCFSSRYERSYLDPLSVGYVEMCFSVILRITANIGLPSYFLNALAVLTYFSQTLEVTLPQHLFSRWEDGFTEKCCPPDLSREVSDPPCLAPQTCHLHQVISLAVAPFVSLWQHLPFINPTNIWQLLHQYLSIYPLGRVVILVSRLSINH